MTVVFQESTCLLLRYDKFFKHVLILFTWAYFQLNHYQVQVFLSTFPCTLIR